MDEQKETYGQVTIRENNIYSNKIKRISNKSLKKKGQIKDIYTFKVKKIYKK